MTKLLLLFIFPLILISCKTDSLTDEISKSCSYGEYFEVNGIVVIEAEKDSLPAGWSFENNIEGNTGEGYIIWRGQDSFSSPGNGLLSYTIYIETPGTYRFNWRSRITIGDDITEHNDNWLKIPDADDFFATKGNTSKIYPHGSGKTPIPEGAGSEGWFKVYMNTVGDWKWDANTSDNDAHQIFATFENEGTYTVLVSGRSNGHGIDRMILYREEISSIVAENLALPQTLCSIN